MSAGFVVAFIVGVLLVDRLNTAIDMDFAQKIADVRAGSVLRSHARELEESERVQAESEKAARAFLDGLSKSVDDAIAKEEKRRATCDCANCKAAREERKPH